MLVYKKDGRDILNRLKEAGYSSTRMRNEKLLNQSAIQSLRFNIMVGSKALSDICDLLKCQPGDIIMAVDPETGEVY